VVRDGPSVRHFLAMSKVGRRIAVAVILELILMEQQHDHEGIVASALHLDWLEWMVAVARTMTSAKVVAGDSGDIEIEDLTEMGRIGSYLARMIEEWTEHRPVSVARTPVSLIPLIWIVDIQVGTTGPLNDLTRPLYDTQERIATPEHKDRMQVPMMAVAVLASS